MINLIVVNTLHFVKNILHLTYKKSYRKEASYAGKLYISW